MKGIRALAKRLAAHRENFPHPDRVRQLDAFVEDALGMIRAATMTFDEYFAETPLDTMNEAQLETLSRNKDYTIDEFVQSYLRVGSRSALGTDFLHLIRIDRPGGNMLDQVLQFYAGAAERLDSRFTQPPTVARQRQNGHEDRVH